MSWPCSRLSSPLNPTAPPPPFSFLLFSLSLFFFFHSIEDGSSVYVGAWRQKTPHPPTPSLHPRSPPSCPLFQIHLKSLMLPGPAGAPMALRLLCSGSCQEPRFCDLQMTWAMLRSWPPSCFWWRAAPVMCDLTRVLSLSKVLCWSSVWFSVYSVHLDILVATLFICWAKSQGGSKKEALLFPPLDRWISSFQSKFWILFRFAVCRSEWRG